MGGGGGGHSLGDTQDLEQRAKEILKEGTSGRKNVFISFSFEDIDEVNLLRAHAKNEKSEIEFNDRSVQEPYDSDRAEYIRQRLTERIRQCSTTIVYLTEHSVTSEWVRWEVEKSVELGKRVIAVHKGDGPPTPSPDFMVNKGIRVVPWSDLASALE